jgi:hypothetical protein
MTQGCASFMLTLFHQILDDKLTELIRNEQYKSEINFQIITSNIHIHIYARKQQQQ